MNVGRPKQISYTVDLTKQYHNLLEMEENDVVKDFYWDTNVVSMDKEMKCMSLIQKFNVENRCILI